MPETIRTVDSTVMGRLPVMVLSGFIAAAGLSQFVGDYGSKVLSDFGGRDVSAAWGAVAMVAFLLVLTARFWPTPQDGAIIEIGGIVLIDAVVLVYALTLLGEPGGIEGRVFVTGICCSTMLNVSGRAVMLWRRRTWVRRVARP